MRISVLLPVAAALTAVAIGSSGEVFARSRGPAPVVRDHRTKPVVRDHRDNGGGVTVSETTDGPTIRDHRKKKKIFGMPVWN